MVQNRLTISIGGKSDHLSVSTVINALKGTNGALYGVARDITSPEPPHVGWQVESASKNSPLTMTFVGRTKTGLDVIGPFMDAVRTLETGIKRPRFLSDDTIRRLKDLVGVLSNGAEEIRFSADGEEPVSPTLHLAANVDAILHSRANPYETVTELEGRLEELSVHGETPEFRIYDILTGRSTECEFNPDDIDRVADLIKNKSRVRVRGLVRYDVLYRAASIKVESFVALREQRELPQMSDLHRAKINITGGMDSVEFVRGLRDAE
jgi:hypothetical protein